MTKNLRGIVEMAENCAVCQKAGKNLKFLKSQKDFGKLPEAKCSNNEISLYFDGPTQNAYKQKKCSLVSADKSSGWTDAMFLPDPSADRVVEFLVEYTAENGTQKRIRTDPGTIFAGNNSNSFVRKDSFNI